LYRKIEEAEAEARKQKAAEDAKIPAGMVRMEESERIHTLEMLQESHKRIMHDISRFPLVIETESRKRQKNALDDKLKEVEEAIKTFSKKIVYITA